MAKARFFGVAAEFEEPEQLLDAARRAREAGFKRMDAYSPFPIHGLSDAIGFRDERVPLIMFLGGVIGNGRNDYERKWWRKINTRNKSLHEKTCIIK